MKQKFILAHPLSAAAREKSETRIRGNNCRWRWLLALSCAMLMSHQWSATAAGNEEDPRGELARAEVQLVQMQGKLDRWLLSAAKREEEVEHQLARRDARIAELSVRLSEQSQQLAELRKADHASKKQRQAQDQADAGPDAAPHESVRRLQTLKAEIQRLRREADSRDSENSKLATYTRQFEARHKQQTAALKLAREAVLKSKQELNSRASRIAQLGRDLERARTRRPESGGTLLKTKLPPGGGAEGESAPQGQSRSDRGVLETMERTAPADALRQAKAGARAASLEYLRLRDEENPVGDPTRTESTEVEQAFRKMFARQARVANLTGARGLYQVRAEDTLSLIAGHATGAQENWPALFTANEHLMASPDQLIEGLVLVIPSP